MPATLMLWVQSLVFEGHGAAHNEYRDLYRILQKDPNVLFQHDGPC